MISKKSWLHLTTVSLVLPLGLIVSPSLTIMAQASPVAKEIESSWQIAQAFQPPAGGAPPITAGGGTRGACGQENPIVPLLPTNKLGLTFEERPTFFLYVPQTKAKEVKFSLIDDKEEVIYETSFATPDKSGIVSISLPDSESAALKVDKMYYWYAEIVCNTTDPSGNAGVDGWVKRIDPSQTLAAELGKANDESDSLRDRLASRASLYAQNGIWHETVTTAVMRIRTNPNDPKATADWETLLNSVGLKEIAKEPLVDCCTASN